MSEFTTYHDLNTAQNLSVKGLEFPAGWKKHKSNPVAEAFKEYLEQTHNPVADDFDSNLQKNTKEKSAYGTDYWRDNLLGIEVYMPIKLGGIDLPNPSISIAGRMNIVETVIVGQEGTVKEEINTNDYDINVRCYVFDDSGTYPEDLVRELADLWKQRKLLTIECVLTDFFLQAKDNCIITGISLPEQQGNEDMQIIELSLRSDREYELILD